MSLQTKIQQWDGKSSADIEAVYQQYAADSGFVSKLIRLGTQAALEKGATWLIKRHLEQKYKPTAQQTQNVLSLLPDLTHWESKLHILQCLPYAVIDKAEKKNLEWFLRNHITHSNKFVRAWAYNGFYELAAQHSEYREEVSALFELALQDEPASIKARIKNCLKKGF